MSLDQDAIGHELNLNEEELLQKMKDRAAQKSTQVREQIEMKKEKEKAIMANIFTKMSEGRIPSSVTQMGVVPSEDFTSPPPTRLNESRPTPVKEAALKVEPLPTKVGGTASQPIIVTQQLNRPAPTKTVPVNDENEPTANAWRPTTVQQLVALYPRTTAVSDLFMVLHGAVQQPGMAFALLAPHGTKYLVRSDETGSLFICDPDPNPKAFANIGLNPDFDGDSVDDSHKNAAKPFQTNSHRVIPSQLESKDDFGLDNVFHEKLNEFHNTPTEDIKDPRVRDTVSKLRAMAKSLRNEEDAPEPTTKTQSLTEEISVKKLNTMLLRAQDKFNKTRNDIYEAAAEELSNHIAEALLRNRDKVPVNRINPIFRKMLW